MGAGSCRRGAGAAFWGRVLILLRLLTLLLSRRLAACPKQQGLILRGGKAWDGRAAPAPRKHLVRLRKKGDKGGKAAQERLLLGRVSLLKLPGLKPGFFRCHKVLAQLGPQQQQRARIISGIIFFQTLNPALLGAQMPPCNSAAQIWGFSSPFSPVIPGHLPHFHPVLHKTWSRAAPAPKNKKTLLRGDFVIPP